MSSTVFWKVTNVEADSGRTHVFFKNDIMSTSVVFDWNGDVQQLVDNINGTAKMFESAWDIVPMTTEQSDHILTLTGSSENFSGTGFKALQEILI